MNINNNEILREIRKDIESLSFEEAKTLVSNLWIQIFEVDKELESLKGFGIINNDEFFNSIQKVRRNLWENFVDETLNLYEQFCINPLFGGGTTVHAGPTGRITQVLIDSNQEAERTAFEHVRSIPIYKKAKFVSLPNHAHETTLFRNLRELHESVREFYAECEDEEFIELLEPLLNPDSRERNIYDAVKIQQLSDLQWLMNQITQYPSKATNTDKEKELKLRKIYYHKLLDLINSPIPVKLSYEDLREHQVLKEYKNKL